MSLGFTISALPSPVLTMTHHSQRPISCTTAHPKHMHYWLSTHCVVLRGKPHNHPSSSDTFTELGNFITDKYQTWLESMNIINNHPTTNANTNLQSNHNTTRRMQGIVGRAWILQCVEQCSYQCARWTDNDGKHHCTVDIWKSRWHSKCSYTYA